jgi:excisionase family DNA binding protein
MAKKYLSIEEAAERLGINADDLKRLREKGEIRAFADRGTWKFREDDIDELGRKRQTDSDPEVPLFKAPPPAAPKKKDDLESIVLFDDKDSGSSINLGAESDEGVGTQPTIVRKNRDDLASSDSDVRLVFDDSLMPDEESLSSDDMEHSDSDVRLISPGTGSDDGSDSDVKLVPDAAPVKSSGGPGSDSDVTLVGTKQDSFSLDLEESDGSFILGGDSGETSGVTLDGSGIALEMPNDSGIALEFDDSGIALETDDSGISLDGGSGITLDGGDSGISLDIGGESGISLDTDDSGLVLAGDSGISLLGPSDSGIALEGLTGSPAKKKAPEKKGPDKKQKADLGRTTPEIPIMGIQDEMGATQMEVPMLGGDETGSEFEFTASELDEDSAHNFTALSESDDSVVIKSPAGKKGGNKKPILEDADSTAEFGSSDLLDSSDAFDSAEDFDSAASDDMEVSDDVIGEDDEISEDVFGAGDEDFDEELTSGSSSAEFVAPTAASSRMAVPIQAEWGGGTFFMLVTSSVVMLLTSFLMYDVVRTMWGNNEPTAGTEMILSSFRGMFGA